MGKTGDNVMAVDDREEKKIARSALKAEEKRIAKKKKEDLKLAEKEEARRIKAKRKRVYEALSPEEKMAEKYYIAYRIAAVFSALLIFFPSMTPTRICTMISKNISLFTSAVSYSAITAEMGRAFDKQWIMQGTMILLYISSIIMMLGILGTAAAACCSLGNVKLKKTGNTIGMIGSLLMAVGLVGIFISYSDVSTTTKPEKVGPMFPVGFYIYAVCTAILLIVSLLLIV